MTIKELKAHIAEQERLDRIASILDRRTKQAKAKAAQHEFDLHHDMEEAGLDLDDHVSFHGTRWARQVDWYAKVQDPLEFNTWAEEHAPHLIQPSPRKAQLNQLVQQHVEDGTPLPPGIAKQPKIWVSRRQA